MRILGNLYKMNQLSDKMEKITTAGEITRE